MWIRLFCHFVEYSCNWKKYRANEKFCQRKKRPKEKMKKYNRIAVRLSSFLFHLVTFTLLRWFFGYLFSKCEKKARTTTTTKTFPSNLTLAHTQLILSFAPKFNETTIFRWTKYELKKNCNETKNFGNMTISSTIIFFFLLILHSAFFGWKIFLLQMKVEKNDEKTREYPKGIKACTHSFYLIWKIFLWHGDSHHIVAVCAFDVFFFFAVRRRGKF